MTLPAETRVTKFGRGRNLDVTRPTSVRPKPKAVASPSAIVDEGVQTGAGVALVPKLAAQGEIESGQLAGISVSEMKLERKLNIVYRKNSVLSHAAEAFLAIAKEISRR